MPPRLTTQEFIERARAVHGERYGYAFSVYQGSHTKLFIHCSKHGMFEQEPNNHFQGMGCYKCGLESASGRKRYTRDKFIKKAKKVHGNKYEYNSVKITEDGEKIKIKCSIHGIFEQSMYAHLNGQGCPHCGKKSCSTKQAFTLTEFIEKAKLVHDDKYDYSLVEYSNFSTKINIVCKKHGVFKQLVCNHMMGKGCERCGIESRAEKSKLSSDDFISRSNKIHNFVYNYSRVKYKDSKSKVTIICSIHGEFVQTAMTHLLGSGCPSCAKYGFDKKEKGYIYLLRSECGRYAKIGITNKPSQRHAQLRRKTPFLFHVVECIEGVGSWVSDAEREILNQFESVSFTESFDGSTEWLLW